MNTAPKTNPLTVLADIAHTQIGVHELGYTNSSPQVQLYQAATDNLGTGWPWCAAFVCWCVAKLAKTRPGLLSCETHNALPKEASVEGLVNWALRTGQLVFTPSSATYSPQAGDIVCMKFPTGRHCGIATGGFAGNCIPTIEGNTSGPHHANPDERNGGEVAAKSRLVPNVTQFIRLTLQGQKV